MGVGKHLFFVSRPTGYELVERAGDPPPAGAEIDLGEEGGGEFVVAKVGPSPLPGDPRPCAYLVKV